MRATERRLSRIEAALQHVVSDQGRQASLGDNAEWRAAGGPVSIVCGSTRDEAKKREAMLRGLGLIQPIDKVVLMPMRP